jgi:hypothetical protein
LPKPGWPAAAAILLIILLVGSIGTVLSHGGFGPSFSLAPSATLVSPGDPLSPASLVSDAHTSAVTGMRQRDRVAAEPPAAGSMSPASLVAMGFAAAVERPQVDVFFTPETLASRAPAIAPPRRNAPRVRLARLDDGREMDKSQARRPLSEPMGQATTRLIDFDSAPFPYDGVVPGTNRRFLNFTREGERGRRTARGRILWEKSAYNDSRVLVHIPKGFDVDRPGVIVVFYHGHGATLERDVLARQQVPAQISASGINAVLVAPQLAVNAADSSPGRLGEPGGFKRFMDEAAEQLARLHGNSASAEQFARMPVVIVAYSGGYLSAAWSLHAGGIKNRVQGVVLLDALYGEIDKFAAWIGKSKSTFFVSAYTRSTRRQQGALERILSERELPYSHSLDRPHLRGSVAFLSTEDVRHRDFVTRAWVDSPIKDVLSRLDEYRL